jgi:MFS family permease
VICVISAAIQAGSVHVAMFLVGRLVNGFGVGLMNSVIPLFQSEISPTAQCGRLVGFHGFILVAGYVCFYLPTHSLKDEQIVRRGTWG